MLFLLARLGLHKHTHIITKHYLPIYWVYKQKTNYLKIPRPLKQLKYINTFCFGKI